MHRVVSGITVFRCNTTTKHFMLFSNYARDALGGQASTSAVNMGDDPGKHFECNTDISATTNNCIVSAVLPDDPVGPFSEERKVLCQPPQQQGSATGEHERQ